MPTTQEQFYSRHRQILVLQQRIQQDRQKLQKQQLQQQKRRDLEREIKTSKERIDALKGMIKKLETTLKQTGKTQQDLKKHANDVAMKFWVRELVHSGNTKERIQKQLGQLTQQRKQIITYHQTQDVPQAIKIKGKIDLNNEVLKISQKRNKHAHAKLAQHLSEQKIQQAVKQYKASLNV